MWLDLGAAARTEISMLPLMLIAFVVARPAFRRMRTTAHVIGAYQADLDRISGRVGIVRPTALRLTLGTLTTVALLRSGAPLWAALVIGAIILLLRTNPLIWLVAAVLAVLVAPSSWLVSITAVTVSSTLYAGMGLRRLLTRPLGAAMGFIPLRGVLRMMLQGTWPILSDGLDKALGDDWRRAEPYFSAVEGRIPVAYRAVISHARALVLGRRGEMSAAFALLASDDDATVSDMNLRAWCAAIEGELLMMAGQRADALAAWRRAVDQLRGRRTAGLRAELGFKLADAAILDRRWLDAYQELRAIRWQAVRIFSLELLSITEGHICRMMLAVGNADGAIWELEQQIVPDDARHGRVGEHGDDTARWHLVAAEAQRMLRKTDEAVQQADMALQRAQLSANLSLQASAHLFLAELHRPRDAALALRHACAGLRRLQSLRYRLPSASWRVQWLSSYSRAFATAFALAQRAHDAQLVAELIEAVKSQGLPIALSGTPFRTLVDSAVTSAQIAVPALGTAEPSPVNTALAAAGVDVLAPPEPVLIGGTAWTQDDAVGGWDLEREVAELAPQGWYWTGCIAADWYWWATLDPAGEWSSGGTHLAAGTPGGRALARLLAALPVQRPGEAQEDFDDRVDESPLMNGWGDRRDLERSLMQDVAEAVLPPPLRAALAEADREHPVHLLVSLPGLLSVVPVAALPIGPDGDTRVVEVAVVMAAPAIATLASIRRRAGEPSTAPRFVLAVIDPARGWPPLEHATAPASADTVLRQPTTRADLQAALRDRPTSLLYVSAHHQSAEAFGSRGAGLAFTDGILGLQELLSRTPSGEFAYPMPPRVLLSACGSLGALASTQVTEGSYGVESAGEWLGLALGVLFAGADHVVSTSFPLLDHAVTAEMDGELAERLASGARPERALREVQLRQLVAWRESPDEHPPMVWQAYTYVGLGPADVG